MESKQEYERSYEDIPLGDAQMPVNDMDEDKTEKKRDYMTFLIMIQVIICIVLFMALFLMSKVGGDSFVSVKSEFDKIMSYDMGITGIKDVFQSAVKFVMAPSNQWKQEKDDNTEKTTSDIMQQKSGKIGMGGPVIDVSDGKAPTKTSFARYTITTAITPPIAQKDGEISSGFGYRNDPISGKWSFHAGLDIA
ncbi:MAG: hypothetical protein LBH71_03105, partial [Oscillospiraceae bacterium]|nr:hypothetical protein [Oscillospiraceae bacterium]